MLDNTRFARYSAYSSRCENIFGCCGLLGAKNAILNTAYSHEEYQKLQEKIINHMKSTGEWGQFFPGSFSPHPYDESWGSFHFPLTLQEQETLGYFSLQTSEPQQSDYSDSSILTSQSISPEEIVQKTYWDKNAQRPFQILPQDIAFA